MNLMLILFVEINMVCNKVGRSSQLTELFAVLFFSIFISLVYSLLSQIHTRIPFLQKRKIFFVIILKQMGQYKIFEKIHRYMSNQPATFVTIVACLRIIWRCKYFFFIFNHMKVVPQGNIYLKEVLWYIILVEKNCISDSFVLGFKLAIP